MPEPVIVTKERMEHLFDGAAAAYDRAGPALFAQWGARLVDLMALAQGAQVLDVATGLGAVLLPAARRVGPAGQVVGIDLAGAMVEEAVTAAHEQGLSNVRLLKMDAETLEFSNASFDAVTCAFAVFLFPAQDAALREMARVCKPGGRVGLSIFGRTPPPFDPGWSIFGQQAAAYGVSARLPQRAALTAADLTSLLGQTGFQKIEVYDETADAVYETEEDWWAFQLTVGTRATILAMDQPTRMRFKEEYLAKMRPLFRADGLHLPVNVLYALARV